MHPSILRRLKSTQVLIHTRRRTSTSASAHQRQRQRPLTAVGAVAATAAAISGGLVGYSTFLYHTDAGFHRMVEAYSTLIPVVLRYRMAEFLDKHHSKFGPWASSAQMTKHDWETLDEWYAVSTVTKLGQLNGMYTKYGQTASGFTNTFSDIWIREFRKLENEVPPRDIRSVKQTIEEETGKPLEDTFVWIESTPLGSASIGQVHRARLALDNREVAVKVQYPEAQSLFHQDIATIRRFCEIFAPEHVVVLDAMEKQNITELDYRNEAHNLDEVQAYMVEYGFQPREVLIPSPIHEYSSKRMLVMDLLPGPKLIDGIREYFNQWAHANGTTLHDLEQQARDRIEHDGIPAKYDGPTAWRIATYRRFLGMKDAICNLGIQLYNTTVGNMLSKLSFADQKYCTLNYQHSAIPPNIPRIMDILMRVHGIQLMKYGVFNADPHGGNFLLLPDNIPSEIGLIDYGSTKRLTRNERLSTCLLYAALYRQDDEKLFEMCQLGGYKSKYNRKDVLLKLLQFGYDSFGKDVTGGKNVQQFMDDMVEQDPWEEIPDNFVLAQFMSIRLRSLALGMNHPIKCSDWWGPMAEQILKEEGLPYESWTIDQMKQYKPELNIQQYKFA